MPRRKIDLPKHELQALYANKRMTPRQIGVHYGCTEMTIRARMKDYGISFRSPSQARMRYTKSDYTGSLTDKAYMLGFRLGDLNVYKTSDSAETIVVRCHTTQWEQVLVIKSLFEKYGYVDDSNKNGHYYTNCYLNTSFDFLMDKSKTAWAWVKKNDQYALAFMAGYIDAEANLIINQGRARLKIDSYDTDILSWMSMWLTSQGIHNKYRLIYKKGQYRNIKYPFKEDLWRLNINESKSLLKYLNMISLFLRHKTRIKHTNKCIQNIKARIKNGTVK